MSASRPLLCCLLSACAVLGKAEPQQELSIRGLSTNKNPQLADNVATARASNRAAWIKSNPRFVLDRSRGKPMLKLVGEPTSTGLAPELTPMKPVGKKATIKLKRSPAELTALSSLQVVRVATEASGLDLAVAHDRADRAVYREAILRFAQAQGKNDPTLYGTLIIVNYDADQKDDRVIVTADISVSFGDKTTVVSEQVAKTVVNEDQEEVPEEKGSDDLQRSASQPAAPGGLPK